MAEKSSRYGRRVKSVYRYNEAEEEITDEENDIIGKINIKLWLWL